MAIWKRRKSADPPRRRASVERLEEEGNRFRRSATLTGTLSDQVHAGAEERGQLQTARMEAQVKRRKRRNSTRRVLTICALIFIAVFLFFNRVSSYDVSFAGGPTHLPNKADYVATAKEFRASSPGNGFTFSLNAGALAEYLMAHHREIASVTVQRHLFVTRPELIVTLRKPVLIWQTSHDSRPFYVDGNGISFSFDGYLRSDAQLVHVNDESGVPSQLGAPVATSRQISFLGQLVGQIAGSSGHKLKVSKIVFPPSSTKEIDVYLQARGYFVKVYLDRSGKAQAEELVHAVNYLEPKGKAPKQYIDVRVPERVFYK